MLVEITYEQYKALNNDVLEGYFFKKAIVEKMKDYLLELGCDHADKVVGDMVKETEQEWKESNGG